MATKVFPKQYTKSEIIPIENGGTGASTAVQARINLETKPIQSFNLADGTAFKITADNFSNGVMMMLKRGDNTSIVLIDYWDSAKYYGYLPPYVIIVKTAGSFDTILQMQKYSETYGTEGRHGAIGVMLIGATATQITYDSTRTSTLLFQQDYYVSKNGDSMNNSLTLNSGGITIANGNLDIGTLKNVNYRGITISGPNNEIAFRNTGTRLAIDQKVENSTGSERFLLPTPEARTSDMWYSILTNKNLVTIEQGGTGVSSYDALLQAMKFQYTQWSTSTSTYTYNFNSNICIIVYRRGNNYAVLLFEYWEPDYVVLAGNHDQNFVKITKPSGSRTITVQTITGLAVPSYVIGF